MSIRLNNLAYMYLRYYDYTEQGVDKCAVNNGGCQHICTSTPYGRQCSCRTGYRLDVDNKSCIGKTSKEPVCPRVELLLKIIIILLIIFIGFIKSKPC